MKRLLAVLLVSLAVTGTTALATPTGTTGSIPAGWGWVPSARTVGAVGDSLVYEAEHGPSTVPDPGYERHYLTDQLTGQGWFARVAARSGADTRSLSMWGGWQSPPSTIVMALGTNDRRWDPTKGFPLPLGTSQWNVVNYLNRWPTACVVLVGIVEAPNRWRHNVYGPAWNRWLRYLADLRGYVYVDWWALSAGHPEWFTGDLLHQTDAGQAAYRNAITEGAKQCP